MRVYLSFHSLAVVGTEIGKREARVKRFIDGARFKLSWLESLVRNLWPAGPDEKADQKKLGARKIGPNFN